MQARKSGFLTAGAATLVALIAFTSPSAAQRRDGFLFERPRLTVSAHGGYARSNAGGDLFDFVQEQLTLRRSDFDGFVGGGSLVYHVTPRLGIEASGTYIGRRSDSEFRDWVDQDDVPITQRTLYERVPLTLGGRYYLVPPGRKVGSFAWIPSSVAPYIGAGAGAVWYRFRQTGEFVDFVDLAIFFDEIESQGWTPAGQLSGGLELSLTPRLVLTTDGEYLWARTEPGRDFVDFERIDLSGFSGSLGISLRL